MFEASEALQKMEGMKKIKSTSFHQYSWNSEVETTWISLIGWHHKTSNVFYLPEIGIGLKYLPKHGKDKELDMPSPGFKENAYFENPTIISFSM